MFVPATVPFELSVFIGGEDAYGFKQTDSYLPPVTRYAYTIEDKPDQPEGGRVGEDIAKRAVRILAPIEVLGDIAKHDRVYVPALDEVFFVERKAQNLNLGFHGFKPGGVLELTAGV